MSKNKLLPFELNNDIFNGMSIGFLFICLGVSGIFCVNFILNLLSFISYYSKNIRKKAEELIANNMVSFIGSDCHNSYQMQLYSECQKKVSLHTLCNSGRLLNSSL